ncbi:hypothetical protein FKG94_10825 [Exilibacterium tricleocarpae]|uniref:histidine kinase n=1 Tax=Exilibacterium tricleocarpae TaxID=2591008 RepID=A0A545TSF6_9GAMM|nr:ATP-binding protein [Exilibacterium tricleocarpae]TQV80153.1 hypothetical protein FKG94_10825 [Exilibacterium tricleocarpae]
MTSHSRKSNSANPNEDAVQKLVYGISHDLGAPLRAVVQFSQLLEQQLDAHLDEKARYWLHLIRDGGSKAQAMVEALLRYSRLSSRMRAHNRFSLQDVAVAAIDEQVNRWRYTHPQAMQPDWDIPAPLPHITGAMEHWHLFFSCVVANALLFQPKDRPDNIPRLRVLDESRNETFCLVIEDNGIGVAENRWPELTRPFMRGQSEQDYPGLGMGLAYCERIAHLHGGSLDFRLSSLGGLAVVYSHGPETG